VNADIVDVAWRVASALEAIGANYFIGGSVASSLQATAPAHAAGPVNMVINCSNGSVTLPGGFLYLAPSAPVPAVSGPALIALLVMLALAGFTALRR